MLNPQEGGRLDAKIHYVILAKALDDITTVGHACAGMTNWPNTMQCLGSDDVMSLGITSFNTKNQGSRNKEQVPKTTELLKLNGIYF